MRTLVEGLGGRLIYCVFLEPFSFVMGRTMHKGNRRRAEAR
jgi:hypothetical protein